VNTKRSADGNADAGERAHSISRCSVVILEDALGRILMFLRDDLPGVSFPNTWGLPGGSLRPKEAADVGLMREIREELRVRSGDEFMLSDLCPLFTLERHDIERIEFAFRASLHYALEDLELLEGQELALFKRTDVENCSRMVPHHREILLQYFASRPGSE
jgi:8-oxo-dGTP diphosphatase